MNKNIHCQPADENRWLCIKKRIIMRIKITAVLMIAAFLQVSASGFAQKITLSERNASLEQLFVKIKKQSGFNFLYSTKLLKEAKTVSLQVTEESLQEVLDKCFEGQPLTYAINKNTVVIRKREESPFFTGVQLKLIKGKVVDNKGLPIPGVTVKIKGSNTTRSTAENGEFTIDAEDGDVLVFTYIGYKRKEVSVKGLQSIRVVLDEDQAQLEDVVVIGYGTQSKRETSGSISTVKGTQLQNKPSGSIEGLLQGLVPGLVVMNNSGLPGGRSNIQLRGLASFSSSANSNVVSTPLFIIDGVPLEQDSFNPSDPRQAITSVLSGFSAFDIESLDVLKDAASTAIYGSRGANGVIVINTKRGKIGKPIVSLNTQYGRSFFPELRKTLGGMAERDFKLNLYDQYKSSKFGGGFTDIPIELTDSLNSFYNNSTDWQKLYFKNTNLKNINLGISGANENSSYRIGADYYDEEGIVLGSGFSRYSLTYSGVFNPTSKLTITGRANLSQTDASQRRGDNFNAAVVGNDFSSSFRPGPNSGFFDAYLDSYNKGVNIDLTRRILGQLEASYDVFKWMNITSRASANYEFYRTRSFSPSATRSDFKSAASYYAKENVNLLSETFLRLHHTFDEKHNLDFLVGNTINVSKNDNIYGAAYGGPSDAQQVIQGYPQSNLTLSTHNIGYGLLSYYTRVSYNYDKKYLFQAVMRADASSKFGKDKQWGYFPSTSVGWVFSKEGFFSKNVGNWFNFGKIRASIGKAGEQYQDNYLALGAYNSGSGVVDVNKPKYTDNGTYNGVPLLYPNYDGGNGIPLPNLTWQTSKEYGVGLDLELFNSRLTMTLDYYNKNKDGFLFRDALNGTSGYSIRYLNSGAVRNTGFEAAITGYITEPGKNFQYSVTFIGGTNKNVLSKLPDFGRSISRDGYGAGAPYLEIGRPLNGFYLLKYLGVYANEDAVPVNKYTGQKLYPNGSGFTSQDPYHAGDIRLLDVNGDGVIDVRGSADKVYSGDPNPKFSGSLSHSFSYRLKNKSTIQLDLFFNYSFGAKVYNKVLADRISAVSWTASRNVNYPGGQRNLLDVSDLDVWTPTHTDAKFPVLNPWRYYATSSYDFIGNYDTNTDLFLENGSFVRLNNINLSYDFSSDFLKKMNIRRLRIYGGLNNVFIIKAYTGVDPENVDNYGYDLGNGYPIPKKFNLGFNFEF
jgi:TonB-linked SusC/RagA family outer membrane protein